MPASRHALATRTAISPRLAISTLRTLRLPRLVCARSLGVGVLYLLAWPDRATHCVRPLTRCRWCPTCRAGLGRTEGVKVIRTGLTASTGRVHDSGRVGL